LNICPPIFIFQFYIKLLRSPRDIIGFLGCDLCNVINLVYDLLDIVKLIDCSFDIIERIDYRLACLGCYFSGLGCFSGF
jgi:hypothetical protein